MPYIEPQARARIEEEAPRNAGELNYCITRIINDYLNRREVTTYADLNEIVGVLECAKLEFYRRIVTPYEEMKLRANGDVYGRN